VTDARCAEVKAIVCVRPPACRAGTKCRPSSRGRVVGGNCIRSPCSATVIPGRLGQDGQQSQLLKLRDLVLAVVLPPIRQSLRTMVDEAIGNSITLGRGTQPPSSIDVGDLPCTKARTTLQRKRKTASPDPRLIACMIRRSRSLSPRQTTTTFVQRHMRNSFRSCAGLHNISVWSSLSFYPTLNRARLFRPTPTIDVTEVSGWPGCLPVRGGTTSAALRARAWQTSRSTRNLDRGGHRSTREREPAGMTGRDMPHD
jgi:hypothetical protein